MLKFSPRINSWHELRGRERMRSREREREGYSDDAHTHTDTHTHTHTHNIDNTLAGSLTADWKTLTVSQHFRLFHSRVAEALPRA